jgi:hypothetical protein
MQYMVIKHTIKGNSQEVNTMSSFFPLLYCSVIIQETFFPLRSSDTLPHLTVLYKLCHPICIHFLTVSFDSMFYHHIHET